MQFLVLAYDSKDDDALNRRMTSRVDHIAMIDEYREKGNMIMGAALLDDDGQMIGSSIIADFPSKKELNEWLKKEPYVTAEVWDKIQIIPCAVGPSFLK